MVAACITVTDGSAVKGLDHVAFNIAVVKIPVTDGSMEGDVANSHAHLLW